MTTDETATTPESRSYWTRGRALYRLTKRVGGGSTAERWGGSEWVEAPAMLGDLLDGDSTLDEVSEVEAMAFLPRAFEAPETSG